MHQTDEKINPTKQVSELIGILGGTFDPIHKGHLHVAYELLRLFNFADVRFIPCKRNVLKINPPQASENDRINMIKLALLNHRNFKLDEREIQREGPSYMIDTLKSLKHELKQSHLCLIISTDAFSQFTLWKDWRNILNYAHLIVIERTKYTMRINHELFKFTSNRQTKRLDDLLKKNTGCIFFEKAHQEKPISGTTIRHLLQTHQSPKSHLPAKVLKYIYEKKLYK